MKTFAEYISSCRVTDTPRGDFIADTQTLINAGKFPDVKRWRDLYGFMSCRSVRCSEAIELARKVWRQYQKSTVEEVLS
jgi:hypothetical protein